MVRRFKSDASHMRADYLGSLLEALFHAVARRVRALRPAAQPSMTMAPRRVAASSWGNL